MKASRKRSSTPRPSSRTARIPNAGESSLSPARFAKATLRGILLAIASATLLSAGAAGIAYATADPDALVTPLSLCVIALSSLIGGLVTYRTLRASPFLCGAACGLGLLFIFFVISCLLPDTMRGQWPSGLSLGLRGGMLAFSLLGAILASYAPARRKHKRKRARF